MRLSRRRLLQLSAVAAGTALAGAAPAYAAEKEPDWAALRARLRGALLQPSDAGYAQIRPPFNLLYDDRYPPAIARCADADDVRKCMEFAAANRVKFAARSGGHSYVAYSTPGDGLVADLKLMNNIEVHASKGTAKIGAGAKLIDVYRALAAEGRALPGGTCGSVGIAGLALGGGIGVLMRKYGLTCDHLASAKIVTPRDLRPRTVDPGSALGWALTGGGGGNFGVTTEFTFRTVPAPPTVTVFVVNFPEGSATDVYGAWQDWITAAPREFWSNISVLGGRRPAAAVPGCLLGGAPRARALIAELERRAGVQGTITDGGFRETDYLGAMQFWSGDLQRRRFAAASRVLATKAAPAKLTALVTGDTKVALEINPLDAAVSDVLPTQTAFAHRGVFGDVQVYLSADPSVRRETANREVDHVQSALAEIATGGAYVNYLNADQPDWATAYYGVNLRALRAIAAKYDPSGVLSFKQGLSPRPV